MTLLFNKTLTVILTLLALTFSAIMVIPAHAANLVVNSLLDTTVVDGNCTLREAIQNANNNAATNADCLIAGSGADTITFSVSGPIALTSSLPTIADAAGLIMDGTGQTVIISGGNAVRVLFVNPGASLTLNSLTIANGKIFAGNHGGGISNEGGTLTITNSTFSGNSTTSGYGGGISNNATGTLTVTNSTFAGNSAPSAGGGGIMNSGMLTISNSTFSGNSATSGGVGGGIYNNSGTATITNSTFSSNSTPSNGGGIYINAGAVTITNSAFSANSAFLGGGIYNLGTLTITNNTFSVNSATHGGGIYNDGTGTATITNNTISSNSTNYASGIDNAAGTVTLFNTIVTNSTTGVNCAGTITADNYNLDSDGSCNNATQKTTAQIKLGSLANNGGPTQTFALLTGSSAIDAGNDTVCAAAVGSPTYGAGGLDQRGVSRPQGAHCDIGSYETIRQSGPNFLVNTNTDTNDTACENAPGNCSLREAIIAANTAAGDDTITVPAGIYTLTIAGTGEDAAATGDLDLTSNITINDAGAGTTIIDGGALDRVFHVTGAFTVNISGVTVRNGNASGADDGGGIFNPVGTLTITNCTFSGNSATGGYGGGIFNNVGDLTITNSTFSGNSASNGGGIFNLSGTLIVTNSTFSGNSAASDRGGGIFNNAGDLTITNSTFSGNSAANGTIYNGIGSVSLRNTIIANSASGGNCSGAFINGGNNIDDGTSCGWGSASGSKSSTPPLLGALANNGGPTQTFALLTGSPAIDGVTFNASTSAPSTDQRGVARPQGTHYDIGSYEFVENTPKKVGVGLPWLLLLLEN